MDESIFDRLVALAACVCVQLAEDSPDLELCFCGVLPGEGVAAAYGFTEDGHCGGMAWVRMGNTYPSQGVGIPSALVGNCNFELSITIEVGVLRAVEFGDDQGNMPSAEELLGQSAQQYKDMVSLLAAIQCCDALPSKDYILGNFTPTGPLGGLLGGRWNLTLVP